MATAAVGLKTHIWNNHLKSMLFLLLYPLIITPLYIGIAVTIITFFSKDSIHYLDFAEIARTQMYQYWYIPYILVGICLVIGYFMQRRHLNLAADQTPVSRQSHPQLYALLENLCISRGMVTPRLFIEDDPAPNAYARGLSQDTYIITVTSNLLKRLNEQELECVLAHELTHIINGDTKLLFVTGIIANTLTEISHQAFEAVKHGSRSSRRSREDEGSEALLMLIIGVLFKIASIGALFIRLFISRKREYIADAGAVELTKNPQAMIAALQKIADAPFPFQIDSSQDRFALIHFYKRSEFFHTHPKIETRIKVLQEINRIEAVHPEQHIQPWKRGFVKEAVAHASDPRANEW